MRQICLSQGHVRKRCGRIQFRALPAIPRLVLWPGDPQAAPSRPGMIMPCRFRLSAATRPQDARESMPPMRQPNRLPPGIAARRHARRCGAGSAGPALLAGCATRPPACDPEALAEYARPTTRPSRPTAGSMRSTRASTPMCCARSRSATAPWCRRPVRTGVRNVLGNLRTPVILANDMLQGEPRRAGDTLGRFLINSHPRASAASSTWRRAEFGVPAHAEDYGQTLAALGRRRGPLSLHPGARPLQPARPGRLRPRHRLPIR